MTLGGCGGYTLGPPSLSDSRPLTRRIGLSLGARLSYVNQDVGAGRSRNAPGDFWVTSLQASYEFLDKRSLLTVDEYGNAKRMWRRGR